MSKVVVMDHPLIAHKIGIIRKKETGTREFRDMVSEIGALITYEATKDLKLQDVEIETPICKTTQKMLKGEDIAIVPILRAGWVLLTGCWRFTRTQRSDMSVYTETRRPIRR